ncbi:MAG: peptidase U32 family protein [Desulfovibrionaceae bacterium]
MTTRPDILAPAGDPTAFLAALAAGADAVYAGLKHFSARMQADNFSVKELAQLAELARRKSCKTYVPFNTLIKPGDLDAAARLIARLSRDVRPDALIVQDLAAVDLARQAGFAGEIHLSTLANVSHPAGLAAIRDMGVSRVVLPRELTIDEIKAMDAACPEGLDLEAFIHGALCYSVSGRCYWSSYMGGKSGLRGRCVQPCRRVYRQKGREARFFSCRDLGLDVLVKALLDTPRVRAWKIEGRKKGAHYVFYVTSAYKLLRDNPTDPQAKKQAMDYLAQALGRESTHYTFLPQRPHNPTAPDAQTGSGLLVGKIATPPDKATAFIKPRYELLPGDLLRVGGEDDPWHRTVKVTRRTPKGGRLDLRFPPHKQPKPGTLVLLIDRREPELAAMLAQLEKEMAAMPAPEQRDIAPSLRLPRPVSGTARNFPATDMTVMRRLPQGKSGPRTGLGLWLSQGSVKAMSRTLYQRIWWWLPPVIWPNEQEAWEKLVHGVVRDGARRFVCNAPWQRALFPEVRTLELTAGPFCNVTNALAVDVLREQGFGAAIVSPELGREDFLALPGQSPLPLGMVLQGEWPMAISRVAPTSVATDEPLESPKKEVFWTKPYGQNTWVYPAWPMDLTPHRPELEKAGYVFFVRLMEARPRMGKAPTRTSTFNWDLTLL